MHVHICNIEFFAGRVHADFRSGNKRTFARDHNAIVGKNKMKRQPQKNAHSRLTPDNHKFSNNNHLLGIALQVVYDVLPKLSSNEVKCHTTAHFHQGCE